MCSKRVKVFIILGILTVLLIGIFLILHFCIFSKWEKKDGPEQIEKILKRFKSPSPLHLKLTEGTYTEDGYTIEVVREKLEDLPGYEMLTFIPSVHPEVPELCLETHKLFSKDIILFNVVAYRWFEIPLLIILNVVDPNKAPLTLTTIYYKNETHPGLIIRPFDPDDVDIKDDKIKLYELLRMINFNLANEIELDIARSIEVPSMDFLLPNPAKRLQVTKYTDTILPFTIITSEVKISDVNFSFHIARFVMNEAPVDIPLPAQRVRSISMYIWGYIPIFMLIKCEYSKFHYYEITPGNIWKPVTDDKDELIMVEMTDYELQTKVELSLWGYTQCIFIALSDENDYTYINKEIKVQRSYVSPGNKKFIKSVHSTGDPFVTGAYIFGSVYTTGIPIGVKLSSVTVYSTQGLPILVVLNPPTDSNTLARYFYLTKFFEWKEFIDSDPEEYFRVNLMPQLESMASFVGYVITLDLGERMTYPCNPEAPENDDKHIVVSQKEKYELFRIYSQIPSKKSDKTPILTKNYSFFKVLVNGKQVYGIPPSTVSEATVHFLDDEIPVGLKLDTGYVRKGFVNNGHNIWTPYISEPIFMLQEKDFREYSAKHVIRVSVDFGLRSATDSNGKPLLRHTYRFGKYDKDEYRLSQQGKFQLSFINFMNLNYEFDSESIFKNLSSTIRVYYTQDSHVPLSFELVNFKERLLFSNDRESSWILNPPIRYTDEKVREILDENSVFCAKVLNLDNYSDYSSSGVDVSVKSRELPGDFVGLTHSFSNNMAPKRVLYRGFTLKFFPNLAYLTSLEVFFKKNIHVPLLFATTHLGKVSYYYIDLKDEWVNIPVADPSEDGLAKILTQLRSSHTYTPPPDSQSGDGN